MTTALLEGKVAIVTGAGGGIGSAIATGLARHGADVALVDRDFAFTASWGGHSSAEAVVMEVEALGRRCFATEGEASDRELARSVVERTLDQLGSVDVLVNCAGGAITPADDSFASTISDADLDTIFAANYRTTVTFSQSVVPAMRAQGSGSIVNITSGVGHLVARNGSLAHYLASKAAVSSYTASLANDVGQHGIRVNAISPGFILTPRAAGQAAARGAGQPEQRERISLRRFGEPDDIAKAVVFFASDLAGYVTGQILAVTGG